MIIRKKKNKQEFWVTNISTEYDVALSDLRLTIRRGRTVNLLDDKHYSYTVDQLRESAESGSIKRKSSVIKVCERAPDPPKPMIFEIKNDYHQLRRQLNAVDVQEKYYSDLDVSPDQEAMMDEELSDAAYHDHAPVLPVDKLYDAGKPKDEDE